MIFQLRMIGSEDEAFVREYELLYTMDLLDFHKFICDDLGYDPMTMASFFRSNDRWERGREFTSMDMGAGADDDAPLPMETVTLGQVLRENRDRLIYTFDPFADRSLFLELMGTLKGQGGVAYPRVTLSAGDPPVQFDAEFESSTGSIFDDVMDDFYDFEGDELADDED